MKNSEIDYSCTDNHNSEFMEGQHNLVPNKKSMKTRIDTTELTEMPNTIHLETWDKTDIEMAINYKFSHSAFGDILIAATAKGVCYMGFTNGDREKTLQDMIRRFPGSLIIEKETEYINEMAVQMNQPDQHLQVHLHLKGTDFQLSIWKKLLQVPFGGLTSYSKIGGNSKIARAAGTAIGSNPVCYILPCHRVIHGDGSFDGYFWGTNLKQRLLTWEAAESAFSLA